MQNNKVTDEIIFAGSQNTEEIFNIVFAESFVRSNGQVVTFTENAYTFGYLESGSAEIIVSGTVFALKENEVFYVSSDISGFSRLSITSDCCGFFFSVNGTLPKALSEVYSLPSVAVRLSEICCSVKKLLNILRYTNNDNYSLSMKESSGVFFNIVSKFACAAAPVSSDENGLEAERIKNYIDNMIYSDPSLDDLKEHFGITKMHAIRVFKNHYNMTPMQYAIGKRTEIASNLLRNTDLSIKTISDMLKYSNTQHFSNSFKKIVGVSPNKYRTAKN